MAIKRSPHTIELMTLTADMPRLITTLDADIAKIVAEMSALEGAGLIYATEYWRKNAKGEPKYLYLLYPQKRGESRRRTYVGSDPREISNARAGIARAQKYDVLAGRHSTLIRRVSCVAAALRDAQRYLIR